LYVNKPQNYHSLNSNKRHKILNASSSYFALCITHRMYYNECNMSNTAHGICIIQYQAGRASGMASNL